MHWFRLRPTFELTLAESGEQAKEKLQLYFSQLQEQKSFAMYGEYGELHLRPEQHRLWSPYLSFTVVDSGVERQVLGRFAPRMEVWTFVWILYLAFGFSAFFGGMLACSQWMLGHTVWGALIVIIGLAAIAAISFVAHLGQHWSSDQMSELKNRLEQVLDASGVAYIHERSLDGPRVREVEAPVESLHV